VRCVPLLSPRVSAAIAAIAHGFRFSLWLSLVSCLWLSLLSCSRPAAQSENASRSTSAEAGSSTSASVPTSASAAPATRRAAGRPRAGCDGLFDPPEGAIPLCNEHVLGDKAEIAWTSWAVTSSRWDAFTPYQKQARGCDAGFVTKPPILSVSKGDQRLSFHESKETGYPSCETKPDDAHPTVIIISTKHDR
jgi:hypothetical protein